MWQKDVATLGVVSLGRCPKPHRYGLLSHKPHNGLRYWLMPIIALLCKIPSQSKLKIIKSTRDAAGAAAVHQAFDFGDGDTVVVANDGVFESRGCGSEFDGLLVSVVGEQTV